MSERMFISARATTAKTDERGPVTYKTEDHVGIMFQIYGSIWKQVMPYCLVNVAVAILVDYFEVSLGINMSFSDLGHTFMSVMVSFLVVTRSKISLDRYMESRRLLSDLMRSCRELMQHTVTFSRYETHAKAKKWRSEISRRTCSLLRTAVSVLEYDVKKQHTWQVAELSTKEKQALLLSVGRSNERSPLVLLIFLRTAIASHVEKLKQPLDVNQELKLLEYTSIFISAYHGLMKLITTPFPFPLVQMTRTFLFVWVYSFSFAINSSLGGIPLVIVVFFVTFGFLGLEQVSIELDNPFGADANDFDALGLAKVVFDDIYVVLEDIDGKEAALALKQSVELPLSEQIKSAVKDHRRFSTIDSPLGGSVVSQKAIELNQEQLDDPSLLSITPPKSPDSLFGDSIEFASSGSVDSDADLTGHRTPSLVGRTPRSASSLGSEPRSRANSGLRSTLLQNIREQDSDASIEVFGADEKVFLDSKTGKLTVKSQKTPRTPDSEGDSLL